MDVNTKKGPSDAIIFIAIFKALRFSLPMFHFNEELRIERKIHDNLNSSTFIPTFYVCIMM